MIQAVKSILLVVSALFPMVGSLVRRRAGPWSTSALGQTDTLPLWCLETRYLTSPTSMWL